MKKNRSCRPPVDAAAFTLVELLVVVGIIAVLAALAFPVLQRIMRSGGEAKSVSAMKSLLQAHSAFSADNFGQIMTLKYVGDPTLAGQGWVAGTFWGRLQPYFSDSPRISNQRELQEKILTDLKRFFGSDPDTMKGTPFEGPKIYHDTSGLPVPFAFNKYLSKWGGWVTQLQIPKPSSTIYATYGFAMFDEQDAATYQELPKNGARPDNNIFYLPPNRTIAGFLDGHVESLTAPIPQNMVKFEGTAP
jgi:prepilin-type N-terminal cleavage/methylation domain-containing protein